MPVSSGRGCGTELHLPGGEAGLSHRTPARAGAADPLPGLQERSKAQAGQGEGEAGMWGRTPGKGLTWAPHKLICSLQQGGTKLFPDNEAR